MSVSNLVTNFPETYVNPASKYMPEIEIPIQIPEKAGNMSIVMTLERCE